MLLGIAWKTTHISFQFRRNNSYTSFKNSVRKFMQPTLADPACQIYQLNYSLGDVGRPNCNRIADCARSWGHLKSTSSIPKPPFHPKLESDRLVQHAFASSQAAQIQDPHRRRSYRLKTPHHHRWGGYGLSPRHLSDKPCEYWVTKAGVQGCLLQVVA